mmetsp:Transcript_9186/g.33076  ORF Transcript_9186/g.33076 Transcript_9186/m.33076 type:complete len:344 (-) Transcript_9186:620-1651(-)
MSDSPGGTAAAAGPTAAAVRLGPMTLHDIQCLVMSAIANERLFFCFGRILLLAGASRLPRPLPLRPFPHNHAALHVVRIGKLVEQGKVRHVVSLGERLDILTQRVRVAGDVHDRTKLADKLDGVVIQTSPRRVHEHGPKVAFAQVEPLLLEPLEGLHLVAQQGGRELLAAAPGNHDVLHAVGLDVVLCGRHRPLGNLSSHAPPKVFRHRDREVPVPAVQLQQVVLWFPALRPRVLDRPLEHVDAHPSVGLREVSLQLAVGEVPAAHVEGLRHVVHPEHLLLLPAPADQGGNVAFLQPLCGRELLPQLLRLGLPLLVELSVVQQGHHGLAGKRGVEVGLEDLLR